MYIGIQMGKQQKGRKFNGISENSGADILAAGTEFHYLKGQFIVFDTTC
jgi:hypothetical protein